MGPERKVSVPIVEWPRMSIGDVRMPPSHTDEGLRAAIEARARVPGTPILVLSQYVELAYADDLLADRVGAVGYVLKDRVTNVDEFLDALRRVAGGAIVLDPEVVSQLFIFHRDPMHTLTPREWKVLKLMADGRTNSAIAGQLFVSEGALEKHVSNIFGKLNLVVSGSDHRRVMAVLSYLRTCADTDQLSKP